MNYKHVFLSQVFRNIKISAFTWFLIVVVHYGWLLAVYNHFESQGLTVVNRN